MLLVQDDLIEEEITRPGGGDERQTGEVEEIVELSSNSVVELSAPKTKNIKKNRSRVIPMIDCSATHKFISTMVVQKLGLPLKETSGYGVLMDTGLAVKGASICRSVSLTQQNIEIIEDFLPLELGSADVILGLQWLESLGGMHVNWKTLSM